MKRPKTTLFISLPGGAQRKKVAFYLFIFILFCIQLNSTFLWFHARYLQNEKKKKKMALTIFTPKALIKFEETDASNYLL